MAHRIARHANNTQTTHPFRAAGTGRFAYNWALSEWKRQYEASKTDHTLPQPVSASGEEGSGRSSKTAGETVLTEQEVSFEYV